MRAVVQRVTKASVTVGDELISSIGRGICVLIGICRDDTPKEMEYIVRKILNLKIFGDDENKRWSKSVMDKKYEVLCVSQFTLYSILKGNKPDFHSAMAGDASKEFYEEFLKQMRQSYNPEYIKDGQFGAYMQVHIQNDGPVTIQLEASPGEAVETEKDKRKRQNASARKSKKEESDKSNTSAVSLANNLQENASIS